MINIWDAIISLTILWTRTNILFIVEARIPFLRKWSHREAGEHREKLPGGRHVEEPQWAIGMQNLQEDNELFGTMPFGSGTYSCPSTVHSAI